MGYYEIASNELIRLRQNVMERVGKSVLYDCFAHMEPSQERDNLITVFLDEYQTWQVEHRPTREELLEKANELYRTGIPEDTAEAGFELADLVRRYFDAEVQ
jgi:hypothetical protein